MQPENGTSTRIAEFRDMEITGRDFRGMAAVFDQPWDDKLTQALGYVETVSRGTFRKALQSPENVPLLGAHRRHELLATTQAGTLGLAEEGAGLEVRASLPNNYLGEYYREMIERGDVKGMSYGIETQPEDAIYSKRDGVMYRSVVNARRLLDVTLTWEPAYPATVAELRSMGFAELPPQETGAGEEPQGVGAAGDSASLAMLPFHIRNRELENTILEKGGRVR